MFADESVEVDAGEQSEGEEAVHLVLEHSVNITGLVDLELEGSLVVELLGESKLELGGSVGVDCDFSADGLSGGDVVVEVEQDLADLELILGLGVVSEAEEGALAELPGIAEVVLGKALVGEVDEHVVANDELRSQEVGQVVLSLSVSQVGEDLSSDFGAVPLNSSLEHGLSIGGNSSGS